MRLNKAIKECNVGLHTAVEFLHKEGFVDVEEELCYKITDEQYEELLKEFAPDAMLRREANIVLQQQRKFCAVKKQGNKSSGESFCEYFEHIKHLNKGKKSKKKKKARKGKIYGTLSQYNGNGYKYKWIRIISTPM